MTFHDIWWFLVTFDDYWLFFMIKYWDLSWLIAIYHDWSWQNTIQLWQWVRSCFLYSSGFNQEFPYRNYQSLKGAVVVALCQNEAEVKCQMDIYQYISPRPGGIIYFNWPYSWDVGVNIHVNFYFSLILAEGRANCYFQCLREAYDLWPSHVQGRLTMKRKQCWQINNMATQRVSGGFGGK